MLHILATFHGPGRVFDGDRLLADVEYSLKAVQGGRERDPGPDSVEGRSIFGLVRSTESTLLDGSVGARLDLELHDGRTLSFCVVKVLAPRVFLIQGLTDLP